MNFLLSIIYNVKDKKWLFPGRRPAPADESPNLTTPEMYSLPVGDVNSIS